jgi:hypothetical protein
LGFKIGFGTLGNIIKQGDAVERLQLVAEIEDHVVDEAFGFCTCGECDAAFFLSLSACSIRELALLFSSFTGLSFQLTCFDLETARGLRFFFTTLCQFAGLFCGDACFFGGDASGGFSIACLGCFMPLPVGTPQGLVLPLLMPGICC